MTTMKICLAGLLECVLLVASLPAHACVVCPGTCQDAGVCIRVRGSGYSSCDVACTCGFPQVDCFVTAFVTPSGKVAVQPCSQSPIIAQKSLLNERTTLGLTVLKSSTGAVVKNVLPESAAFRAGLRPGDAILEIDGKQVSRMPYERITNELDGSNSQTVLLVVNRGFNRVYSLSPETIASIDQRIKGHQSQLAHVPAMSTATMQ